MGPVAQLIPKAAAANVVLMTINAKYHHASLGLRYLRANMGDLRGQTHIKEFVLDSHPMDIVEQLLAAKPSIVGMGVYIWNTDHTLAVLSLLKTIAPEIVVVLGGPEVSYEVEGQALTALADYVITGWGDVSFAALVRDLLQGQPPSAKIIKGVQPPLDSIVMPYSEFNANDIAQRTIYVEASRGCPFKCEFCLSALDATAWPFALDAFLAQMEQLYNKGLRQFKFVDRTFNLKPETGVSILQFFWQKLQANPDDLVFVHFEVIPDHLPDSLKEMIAKFPPLTLQFELGLQTLNPVVQKNISRRTNLEKAKNNIRWLVEHSAAHLHVDLIAGLPGEDMLSFAAGFNELWSWQPHEIQLGILKRLKGTPIIARSAAFDIRYQAQAPYQVLSTNTWTFSEMQWFRRFARFWDVIANSGRFKRSLPFIMAVRATPFASFAALVDYLYGQLNSTYKIAFDKLIVHICHWLAAEGKLAEQAVLALEADYQASGQKGELQHKLQASQFKTSRPAATKSSNAGLERQHRHLAAD